MSQAGIVDFEGTHPQVPTSFVTNMGTAVPIANILEVLGTTVTAHSIPIQTTGSGNTVTIQAQYASAAGTSVATNAGFSSFNSTQFTVDSNGFVSLTGSGAGETITGNTGGPLAPVLGNWNIFGTSTAAGTIPVQTSGSGNTLTVQVQKAQAIASTNSTNVGLSAFNSSEFTVDVNGFVSLVGGGSAIESVAVDANTAPGTNPVLPTLGKITVTGGQVAAGTTTNVIRTDSLAANTYTIQIQRSQAVATTTIGDNGVSHFNSSFFTVDANGFVSLNGSAVGETITGNTGGALSPTAGNWNILGTSTAAGTTPVQTSGTASTLTVQVQKSQAIASTDATKIGLSAFNSAEFTVDANGFVSLVGGGASITGVTVDAHTAPGTSPVVPNGSGNIIVTGGQVASGTTTNVIQTNSLAANTYTVQIQRSQAVASTTVGDNGVSHFDSARFTVDANGFVSVNGSGLGETITGNSGGALSPSSGNWNILGASTAAGTSPVTTSGTGSTLTVNVQKSQAIAATDATKIGLSNFNSAQFTVDANGFVALVTASPLSQVAVQRVTATGAFTYTPTTNMKYVIVELIGGGGGGGGVPSAGAGNASAAGGGGSGGYAKFLLTAAQVGSSLTGSVGTGGNGGAAGVHNGSNGGDTTLATTSAWTAGGGGGGVATAAAANGSVSGGAAGTITTGTGTVIITTSIGGSSSFFITILGAGGAGGSSPFGFGGSITPITIAAASAGNSGALYGGGGSGAVILGNTATGAAGGNGAQGIAIFTEFV